MPLRKSIIRFLTPLAASALLWGCNSDTPQMISLGIDDSYRVARMSKLTLAPAYSGTSYRWLRLPGDGEATNSDGDGEAALLSTSRTYTFVGAEEGKVEMALEIVGEDGETFRHRFTVEVVHEEIEYSPRISRVVEYRPAPGQFVNIQPLHEPGDTYADMLIKAQECIAGDAASPVSLGGFGGYITFAFDHTVVNLPGYDFMIHGNAIYQTAAGERPGGSAEPGVVWVAFDANSNGLPDPEEWYQLAGSEYHNPDVLHGCSITYHAPDPGKPPVKVDSPYIVDAEYISWQTSVGEAGFMPKNSFHSQDYYPRWVGDDRLTFTGTLLPPNAVDYYGTGMYYILYPYAWGYADNHPDAYPELNSFDISNAVDSNGMPVHLPGVDFIRVVTGINQYCNWIGETSTEISGATDLHLAR